VEDFLKTPKQDSDRIALTNNKATPGFDVVFCLGPHKVQTAKQAIRSVQFSRVPGAFIPDFQN
jgi:hypothetical protein